MSKFKVGDRVRYVGGNLQGRQGKKAMIVGLGHHDGACQRYNLTYEDGGSAASVSIRETSLERIEDVIDLTKPLELFSGTNDTATVTFVTETSDGHVLVSYDMTNPKDSIGRNSLWFIMGKDGRFVRSESGMGTGLRLRNKSVEKKIYVRVAGSGGSSLDFKPQEGTAVACIELTLVDGIATAVRLQRPNINPMTDIKTTHGSVVKL
jgi:hypothetical protein